MNTKELEKLLADVTPGKWEWQVHDYSMASLGVGDSPGYGTPFVMSVSPCNSCTERSDKKWKWGRCCTPTESNARIIALSPTLARRVIAAEKLVDSLRCYANGHGDDGRLATDAITEWESAQ